MRSGRRLVVMDRQKRNASGRQSRIARVLEDRFALHAFRYGLFLFFWIGAWLPSKYFRVICRQEVAEFRYENSGRVLSEKAARRLLDMSGQVDRDSMIENVIHFAHATIGLHQLERGEIEAASESLVQSSKTPGSPHLDSFGPTSASFDLANGLLAVGKGDVVIEFLRNVMTFWKMERAQRLLSEWMGTIEAGGVPVMSRWE